MKATIFEQADGSGTWVVESCRPEDDGICEKAIFYGPNAERQAREFIAREYGPVSEPLRQRA